MTTLREKLSEPQEGPIGPVQPIRRPFAEVAKSLLRRLFSRTPSKPRHLITLPCALDPSVPTLPIDNFAFRPGSYRVLIEASLARVDSLQVKLLLRPSPTSPLVPFAVTTCTSGELFGFSIPACSGFQLELSIPTGRPVRPKIHIWEV